MVTFTVGTKGVAVFAGGEDWTAPLLVATVLVGVATVRLTTDAGVAAAADAVGLLGPAAVTGFTGPLAAGTDPTGLLPAAPLVRAALTATDPTDPTGAVPDPTVC